jgi:hypothetical protein
MCDLLPRVGSIAQIPAVEFGGDGAFNGQVEFREFVGDRCEIASGI